jgi:hypothetical protein
VDDDAIAFGLLSDEELENIYRNDDLRQAVNKFLATIPKTDPTPMIRPEKREKLATQPLGRRKLTLTD